MFEFFFELDLPNRETTVEIDADDYQTAEQALKQRFPSATGWYCINPNQGI